MPHHQALPAHPSPHPRQTSSAVAAKTSMPWLPRATTWLQTNIVKHRYSFCCDYFLSQATVFYLNCDTHLRPDAPLPGCPGCLPELASGHTPGWFYEAWPPLRCGLKLSQLSLQACLHCMIQLPSAKHALRYSLEEIMNLEPLKPERHVPRKTNVVASVNLLHPSRHERPIQPATSPGHARAGDMGCT